MTQRLINNRKYPDVKITLTGDISGSGSPIINTTINAGVVGISNLSATGTPSSTTYLRGDNTWATIPSGGTWGSITGTLSNQTDLQNALNLKYDASNPAGYITSSALSGYLQNNVGISGGTTLIGGTASGNNLTLVSTSNATKGKILFGTSAYDEVNNRLGIGTTTPAYLLSIGSISKGFAEYNSGGGLDAIKVVANNAGAGFGVQNLAINGFSGVEYIGSDGALKVFTGYQNSTGEFRFNNIATNGYITFKIAGSDKLTIANTGNVGIGTTSPTAYLHLKAGTTSANTAPLKFTAGTNLTTAESGAMEWDGSRLYITNTTQTRNTIAYLTDIVAGTDNYVDSVSFNTGNGVLTLGRTGALPDLTTSLDGRYALSSAGMPTGTEGQMLYNNAGVWTSFSGMYWDDTNNRLGVGTNSPSVGEFGSTFTVKGTGSEVGIITAQRNVSALANGTGFQTVLNNSSNNPVTYSYFNGYIITNTAGAESGGLMFYTRNAGTLGARMTILNNGNTGIGTTSPTAYLHLKAGTATANTAPLKFTTGTNTTVAVAGQMEYNNTFHLTNSDATRRHIVTAPNTTKVTASAPYTNDGYITINIGGTNFKVMTTA